MRILGIFDTVASVGPSGALGSHGHHDWATAKNLKIHPDVKNCYHIVALHELRMNFPLDSVTGADGKVPEKSQEVFLPGSHSDIGGGYGAGEQGKIVLHGSEKPVKDDRYRLSALALNRMLEAALKSCEGHSAPPWLDFESKKSQALDLRNRFSRDQLDEIHNAVENYFGNACTLAQYSSVDKALQTHCLRYLAWRYSVTQKNAFEQLQSVQIIKALNGESTSNNGPVKSKDLRSYRKGEEIFKEQIEWLTNQKSSKTIQPSHPYHRQIHEIFEQMKSTKLDEAIGIFFDTWVHDSFADFIGKFGSRGYFSKLTHRFAETQAYVRWRGLYAGSDSNLLAENNTVDQQGQELAAANSPAPASITA